MAACAVMLPDAFERARTQTVTLTRAIDEALEPIEA